MKKIFTFLIISIFLSCSQDPLDVTESNVLKTTDLVKDLQIPQYSDLDSFLEEYENLSTLKSSEEIENWLDTKGHFSLLKVSDSIFSVSDSLGVIYSDALMALFNKDGRAQIGLEHVLLNKNSIYSLGLNPKNDISTDPGKLTEFGKVRNYTETEELKNPGNYIPNANKWKTYIYYYGSKRLITELYNETLIFSGNAYSSKMFLRFRMDYESCSFWRCTWKNDTGTVRRIEANFNFGDPNIWLGTSWDNYNSYNLLFNVTGHYNFLIANHNPSGSVLFNPNFYIYGTVTTTVYENSQYYTWVNNDLAWY